MSNNYNSYLLSLFCVVLFFIANGSSINSAAQYTFYLDHGSTCLNKCGDSNAPFSSFAQAIEELSKLKHHETTPTTAITPVLIVEEGEYNGEKNKALTIDFNLNIISTGKQNTIIDCQNIDYAIRATGATNSLYIKGLTIKNCISIKGAAILTSNSMTKLEDVAFDSNSAKEGSAIYSTAKLLLITSCTFVNNAKDAIILNSSFTKITNSLFYNNGKDLVCNGGSVVTKGSEFGSSCSNCDIINEKRENKCQSLPRAKLCNSDGACDYLIESYENCQTDCPKDLSKSCNYDGTCDSPYENAIDCPSDCDKVNHPGWKLLTMDYTILKPLGAYQQASAYTPISIEYLELPKIVNFKVKKSTKLSGILSSQFTVVKTGEYYFNLNLKGLAAIMYIDGQVFFDVFIQENLQPMSLERKILLSSDQHHTIEIYFTAVNDLQRDLELNYRLAESGTQYTLVPSSLVTIEKEIYCGDGICNEHPATCLRDCYDSIEKECPAQSPPSDLQSYYGPVKDTLGKLLNNQFIFSLPGINYMSHGMDIQTGETLPTPLFSLTYCDNSSFSLVHCPHRGLVYSLPPGLFAQISPKCTMDTSTKTYSSSSQMAMESSLDMGLDVSASGSGGGFFGRIAVSASLSLSQSTKKASATEAKMDGSLSKTELKCEVSKVHMVEPYKFSAKFIEDVSKTYTPADKDDSSLTSEYLTKEKLKNVISNFGTIYYKSATLGGKLEQISVTSHTFASSKTSSEVEKSMDMSFSVQASSKILPVSGSVSMSGSMDSKTSQEQQSTFEANSARSTMTVYGGKPGSYGDDRDPNSLSTWASTVDFIPHPIDYQVGYVADILPEDWFIADGLNVKKLWLAVEMEMYRGYFKKSKTSKYLNDAIIDSLKRKDTIYLAEYDSTACDFNKFDMKIQTSTGSYDYTFGDIPKSYTYTIIPLEFDDTKGIQSLQFVSKSNPIKTFTCSSIKLFNLNTGRSYILNKDTTIANKYNNVKSTPNTITLEFENPIYESGKNLNHLFEIDFVGTTGLVKRTSSEISTALITFTDYDDFGDLVGLSITVITNKAHYDSMLNSFKFSFKSVKITQSCPDNSPSPCIPKKAQFNKDEGFAKTYEAWPRKNGIIKFDIPFSKNPKWIPVAPIGK